MNEPTDRQASNIINHHIALEISEDRVFVEIDGLKGEVTLGQAREVREMLAHAAINLIQETTRARRAELEYLAGDAVGGAMIAGGQQVRRRELARAVLNRY